MMTAEEGSSDDSDDEFIMHVDAEDLVEIPLESDVCVAHEVVSGSDDSDEGVGNEDIETISGLGRLNRIELGSTASASSARSSTRMPKVDSSKLQTETGGANAANRPMRYSTKSLAVANTVNASQRGSLKFDREIDSAAVKGVYQHGSKELLRQSLTQFYKDFAPEKIQVKRKFRFNFGSLNKRNPLGVGYKSSVDVDIGKVVDRYFDDRETLFTKLQGLYGSRPVFPPLSSYAHAIYRSLHNFYSIYEPDRVISEVTSTSVSCDNLLDVRSLAESLSQKNRAQQAAFNQKLRQKYGDVPITPPLTVPQHRLFVSWVQFYRWYNPSKLNPENRKQLDLVRICKQCADDPFPLTKRYSNQDEFAIAKRKHFAARRKAREAMFRKVQQQYGDRPVYPPLTERELLLRHSVRLFYQQYAPYKLINGSVDATTVAKTYVDSMHILFDKLQGIYNCFPTFPPRPPHERENFVLRLPPKLPPRSKPAEDATVPPMRTDPAPPEPAVACAFAKILSASDANIEVSYLPIRDVLQEQLQRPLSEPEKAWVRHQLVLEAQRNRKNRLKAAAESAAQATAEAIKIRRRPLPAIPHTAAILAKKGPPPPPPGRADVCGVTSDAPAATETESATSTAATATSNQSEDAPTMDSSTRGECQPAPQPTNASIDSGAHRVDTPSQADHQPAKVMPETIINVLPEQSMTQEGLPSGEEVCATTAPERTVAASSVEPRKTNEELRGDASTAVATVNNECVNPVAEQSGATQDPPAPKRLPQDKAISGVDDAEVESDNVPIIHNEAAPDSSRLP